MKSHGVSRREMHETAAEADTRCKDAGDNTVETMT
jgi:hypothetical protein